MLAWFLSFSLLISFQINIFRLSIQPTFNANKYMDQILFCWFNLAASIYGTLFAGISIDERVVRLRLRLPLLCAKVLCLTFANNTRLWAGLLGLVIFSPLWHTVSFWTPECDCSPPVLFRTFPAFWSEDGHLRIIAANARTSLNAGLRVAFRSGAVMGLVVVGLACLIYLSGICCWMP